MNCVTVSFDTLSPFICAIQWAVLTRKHAEVVVEDEEVLPEFQKHCRVCDSIFMHSMQISFSIV